ncbi:ferredoxin [Aldersonia sp. NBC_00410]|uniref:ferredoxin n=1 Tax=Aldersonia sp. NBC_00410 TaxID=2975954 RepID=UPI0022532A28|nr:ferredoxin [Aldersonia sp. NBC_00410]MCX5044891.1 ferredoxin [Aldersonia sp. NBC_00410]
MRIEVDYGLCEANAICVGILPDVFDLNDDDELNVLAPEVTPDNEELVADAVRQCPRQAIAVVD